MGFYYYTYLCSGKFTDKLHIVINKKIQIASIDAIIERHEWDTECVKKNDLIVFLSGKNIDLIYSDTYDLFLEESCSSTLSENSSNTSKYILVERNCNYEN